MNFEAVDHLMKRSVKVKRSSWENINYIIMYGNEIIKCYGDRRLFASYSISELDKNSNDWELVK